MHLSPLHRLRELWKGLVPIDVSLGLQKIGDCADISHALLQGLTRETPGTFLK